MKNSRIYIVSHVYYNHYRMTDILTASTDLDAVKDYICTIQYSGLIYTPEDSICIPDSDSTCLPDKCLRTYTDNMLQDDEESHIWVVAIEDGVRQRLTDIEMGVLYRGLRNV